MTAKQRDFETSLDDCLARIRAGEGVEACLVDYPEQVDQLRPLLVAAVGLYSLPDPKARPAAVAGGRQRMLDAVEQKWPAAQPVMEPVPVGDWLSWLKRRLAPLVTGLPALRFAVALLLVVLLGGFLATAASAGALPGDVLYPVKRTWEEVRLFLTLDDGARQELEAEQARERLREIDRLLETGRHEQVTFTGQLLEMGEQAWQVGDLLVLVDQETIVEGDPAVGRWLEVRAVVQNDDQVRALHIRVQAGVEEPPIPAPTDPQGPQGPTETAPAGVEPSRTPRPTSTTGRTAEPTRTPQPGQTPHRTAEPSPTPRQAAGPTQEPNRTAAPTQGSNQTAGPTQGPNQTAAPTQGPQQTAGPDQTAGPTHEPQQTPGSDHTPGPDQKQGQK